MVLLKIEQVGGIACHTGRRSCFFQKLENGQWVMTEPGAQEPRRDLQMSDILDRLADTLEARKQASPDSSYVAKLYCKGTDAILKKIGEEATETVMAAKDDQPEKIIYEVADLWFHTLVLLAHKGLKPADVLNELARREGLSGLG